MAALPPAISTSVRHQFDQEVAFLQRLVRAKSANPFLPEASRSDVPIEAEVAACDSQGTPPARVASYRVWDLPPAPQCPLSDPRSGASGKNPDFDSPYGYR
jgi:hypothetical protein